LFCCTAGPGSNNLAIIIGSVVGGVVLIAMVTVCLVVVVLLRRRTIWKPSFPASPAAVSSQLCVTTPHLHSSGHRGYYNNGYSNNQ